MYIDDGAAGDPGELKIDLDGHEYTEQENYSYQHDDVVDSVSVDTVDGDRLVYTDTQHSGSADLVTEYDQDGAEVRQATFHPDTGTWVDSAGTEHADAVTASGAETINVDTPTGAHNVGPATVDTNSDGRPDTAVVHDGNGDTIMYTDTDADGQADVAVEIDPDGQVVIAEHTGDQQWTSVEQGHLDADGQYHRDVDTGGSFDPQIGAGAPDGDQHWSGHGQQSAWATAFSGSGSAQGVVRIDATTGQWISAN